MQGLGGHEVNCQQAEGDVRALCSHRGCRACSGQLVVSTHPSEAWKHLVELYCANKRALTLRDASRAPDVALADLHKRGARGQGGQRGGHHAAAGQGVERHVSATLHHNRSGQAG